MTDVRANISGLYFTPRCPQHSGNYTVQAVNDYGFIEASAFVHVVCQWPDISSLILRHSTLLFIIRSFRSIHNVVNGNVLQAMWEELAGKVGHYIHLLANAGLSENVRY